MNELIKIVNNDLKLNIITLYYFSKVSREDYLKSSILNDLLVTSTKKYPKRFDLNRKVEDLYGLQVFSDTSRLGDVLSFSLSFSFLSSRYIKDKNYPKDIIEFIDEILNNPNISDGLFDEPSFNKIKQDYLANQKTISENPRVLSAVNAIDLTNDETIKVFLNDYTKEEIDSITNDDIVSYYRKLIKSNNMIITFTDSESSDKFSDLNKFLSKERVDSKLSVLNPNLDKVVKEDESNFNQSNLVLIYKLNDLTKREQMYAFNLFNYIFANGSFKSKLFRKLREENSFCYGVGGTYIKYDGIYVIKTSLLYENIKPSMKLIKESLKEMINGDFDDSILEEAKLSTIDKLNNFKNYPAGYVSQKVFEILDEYPSIDDRIKEYQTITKDEIINLSKKIELYVEYTLKEGPNHE